MCLMPAPPFPAFHTQPLCVALDGSTLRESRCSSTENAGSRLGVERVHTAIRFPPIRAQTLLYRELAGYFGPFKR
jgi:hypothetical protein